MKATSFLLLIFFTLDCPYVYYSNDYLSIMYLVHNHHGGNFVNLILGGFFWHFEVLKLLYHVQVYTIHLTVTVSRSVGQLCFSSWVLIAATMSPGEDSLLSIFIWYKTSRGYFYPHWIQQGIIKNKEAQMKHSPSLQCFLLAELCCTSRPWHLCHLPLPT